MIVLFTDFGLQGPYTGQMKAALHQMAPGIPTIDLFADAPAGNPKAAAYLLAAYAQWFAAPTTFLCIVDPGVGGPRAPVILEADGRWYVGPDNGLFELRRAPRRKDAQLRHCVEAEKSLCELSRARSVRTGCCHAGARRGAAGRATQACGAPRGLAGRSCRNRLRRPFRQCYDRRARIDACGAGAACRGGPDARARNHLQPPGTAFWYENSNGLAEIAVNRGRADRDLGLGIGSVVEIIV
jgi:S-adenosylmethionine hydrolase